MTYIVTPEQAVRRNELIKQFRSVVGNAGSASPLNLGPLLEEISQTLTAWNTYLETIRAASERLTHDSHPSELVALNDWSKTQFAYAISRTWCQKLSDFQYVTASDLDIASNAQRLTVLSALLASFGIELLPEHTNRLDWYVEDRYVAPLQKGNAFFYIPITRLRQLKLRYLTPPHYDRLFAELGVETIGDITACTDERIVYLTESLVNSVYDLKDAAGHYTQSFSARERLISRSITTEEIRGRKKQNLYETILLALRRVRDQRVMVLHSLSNLPSCD